MTVTGDRDVASGVNAAAAVSGLPSGSGAVRAPDPLDEVGRLADLRSLRVLDSAPEEEFEEVVRVACALTGTPMGAVTLVDANRQWFKAEQGLGVCETGRDESFCAYALLDPRQLFVVPDAGADPRFSSNPLVVGPPFIGAYAGAPLVTSRGHALGSLCVMDARPREFAPAALAALADLAGTVVALLEARLDRERLALAVSAATAAHEETRLAARRSRQVFDCASQGLAIVEIDGVVRYANPAFRELAGWVGEAVLVGRHFRDLTPPDERDGEVQTIRRLLAGSGKTAVRERGLVRADGDIVRVLLTSTIVREPDGQALCFLISADSIEDRRAAETALLETQSAIDGIVSTDRTGRITAWNDGAARMFGRTRREMLGHDLTAVIPADLRGAHLDGVARVTGGGESRLLGGSVAVRGLRADGSEFPVELTLATWTLDDQPHYTAVIRDVTEREQARAAFDAQARTDRLTGLGNRLALTDLAATRLAEGSAGSGGAALIVLDIDRFRDVNDSLGHDHADELLREVARCLTAAAPPGCPPMRVGSNTFALLLPVDNTTTDVPLEATARRLAHAISGPHAIAGIPVELETSAGIGTDSLSDQPADDGGSPLELVQRRMERLDRRAETALHQAKTHGDHVVSYRATLTTATAEDLLLLSGLRSAIEEGQLRLHYQPLTDTGRGGTGRPSVEALVRWQHPQLGFLPPGRFLPQVEPTRLIVPLTRWVLEAALLQRTLWFDDGLDIDVSVNLSPRTFARDDITTLISEALATHGCPADRLTVEVTETALADDPVQAERTLRALRDLGVRVSLDDFGSGYTSLAIIRRAPLDEIKIDQAFVRELSTSPADQVVVASVVTLAHGLGLTVVAEGVEDAEAARMLVEIGCDYLQGYHLARPVPSPELPAALAAARGRLSSAGIKP